MSTKRVLSFLVVTSAISSAIVASWLHVADARASRNGSGTYSLPAGQPVVSGTTITSATFNTLTSDMSTEMTDSLSRSGKGGMSAALKLSSGTVSTPGLDFGSETNSGLYRNGSHDLRFSVNGADSTKWLTTGFYALQGITATTTQVDGGAIYGTGNGQGYGVVGTAGSQGSNYGVAGYGSSQYVNSTGVLGVGGGIYAGGFFLGGFGAGNGVHGVGGGDGGTGSSSGVGGRFGSNIDATASVRTDAAALDNGDLEMDGVANPNSTVAFKNRLTPANITKAWVNSTSTTVNSGFNISGVACSSNVATVSFAQAMGNANYSVTCTPGGGLSGVCLATNNNATSGFDVKATNCSAGSVHDVCAMTISCTVTGAQ